MFSAASDDAIADLERSQRLWREGPGRIAEATGGIVAVPDLGESGPDTRWPHLCAEAKAVGVRAVAAVPLLEGSAPCGVVNFYVSGVCDWSRVPLKAMQLRQLLDFVHRDVWHFHDLVSDANVSATDQARGAIMSAAGDMNASGKVERPLLHRSRVGPTSGKADRPLIVCGPGSCQLCECPMFTGELAASCTTCGHLYREHV
jgi:hypothetical protein